MYATLETYDLHDAHCEKNKVRENFMLKPKPKTSKRKQQKEFFVDTPELRRQRRGGKGWDGLFCQPYDEKHPYMYMFNPRYNKYPYDPNYKVVDGEDDGKRYLNVPLFSYPSSESTTRVLYCNDPPKLWEFCNDDY
jgi:hypothetical protein